MTRQLPVAGVVPAAGRSRRFGTSHKLLVPYGDTTVLGATLAALADGGVDPLIVVVREEDDQLRRWLERRGIRTAINPTPGLGMLSSIWAGLGALCDTAEGAADAEIALAVCPADLPALDAETVRRLRAVLDGGDAEMALPTHGGDGGHPLLIAPALVDAIVDLDPDVGLRQLLDRHPERLTRLPVDDPGCVTDVDTRDDLDHLRDLDDRTETNR